MEQLAPLLFLLIFPVMWLTVTALLSAVSGWPALADRFPSRGVAVVERIGYVSGSVGRSPGLPVAFRNSLVLTLASEGFELSTIWMFRFMHRPLFVPWTEVASVEQQNRWMVRRCVVRLRDARIRIAIAGKPGESLAQAYAKFKVV